MQPEAYALKVAQRAAKNVGGPLGELLKRAKSQAYLFGRLRARFPGHPEAELRQVVDRLRRQHGFVADEPVAQPRRASKGREELSAPVWGARAGELTRLFGLSVFAAQRSTATSDEILADAKAALGWERNYTIQVLAAAESAGRLEYSHPFWLPVQEHQMAKSKVKVTKITRTLPCVLSPEEVTAATSRYGQLVQEERALESQLKAVVAEVRSKLASRRAEAESVLLAVSLRAEAREVPCEERYVFNTGVVEVVRLDTGALVERRTMTAAEGQMELG